MDAQLQRLLETEARAQVIIDAAGRQHQRLIDEALAAAREAEARFEAARAELRAPFLNEARARADQAVAELTHRYGERQRTLRELASQHESAAVDAALALLLDPGA